MYKNKLFNSIVLQQRKEKKAQKIRDVKRSRCETAMNRINESRLFEVVGNHLKKNCSSFSSEQQWESTHKKVENRCCPSAVVIFAFYECDFSFSISGIEIYLRNVAIFSFFFFFVTRTVYYVDECFCCILLHRKFYNSNDDCWLWSVTMMTI